MMHSLVQGANRVNLSMILISPKSGRIYYAKIKTEMMMKCGCHMVIIFAYVGTSIVKSG